MTQRKNKFISVVLAVMVALAWSVPAFADDVDPNSNTDGNKEIVVQEGEPGSVDSEPAEEDQPSETPSEDVADDEREATEGAETPAGEAAAETEAPASGNLTEEKDAE